MEGVIVQGSKTILVPVDFQQASLEALALARSMATPLGLEVVLLHVYSVPVVIYPGFEPLVSAGLAEEIATAAKTALDKLAADAGWLRSELRSGDPVGEILHAIEVMKPAFVAMGTHGRTGVSHLFLGSVAERVARASRSPVLIVHAQGSEGG